MSRKSDKSKGGERKKYYMISAISQMYDIHPQTLRLYEREGLLKPSRTEGNTRIYTEEDIKKLETILNLTREMGVNLAGIDIILQMKDRLETLQDEINQFLEYVREEFYKGREEEFTNRRDAIVRSVSTKIIRVKPDGHKPQET